ncbi:MAG: PilN domain-containing protein [Armatimonadota bacterium]
MIKINLLPDSIFEPARKKALLAGSVVVLAALAVGMFVWSSTTTAEKLARTDECNAQKLAADAVDRIEAQVTTVEQSFAELKTKVQNVRDIYCHNLVYVKLYKTLADWTPSSYRYDSMVARNATANMNVYTRKLDDVAYYLQSMQKCPAIAPAGISLGMYSSTTANGSGGGAAPATASPMGAMSPMMPMSPSGGGLTSPMMPMSPGSTAPSTSGASAPAQNGSGQSGYVFPVTVTLKSSVPPAPAGFGPVAGSGAAGGAAGPAGGMGLMGSPTSGSTGNFGAPGTMMMPRPPGSGSTSAGPSIPGGGPMTMPGAKK